MPSERYPVIQEGKTELEQIADSLPGLIEDVGDVLRRAKLIISDENLENVSKALAHIEEFTDSLASQSEPIAKLVADLNLAAEDLKRVSASVRKTSDTAGKEIEKLSGEMSVTMAQITKTAARLEKDSKQLNTVVSRGVTRLVLEFANVAEDISNAARTFTSTVEQFEDPRALIAGPSDQALGPGETRK
jgi:ABC-type transporter Mla subunit MlaD